MTATEHTIKIQADSELGQLLRRAADPSTVLVLNGERFRVVRERPDPFENYDPKAARAAFAELRGLLTAEDAEELKAELRAQRDQNSIGRPR